MKNNQANIFLQEPRVFVIILNWNSWRHTIECLESVFRLSYRNFHVVVCDNSSSDKSIDYIKLWALGKQKILSDFNPELSKLINPPVRKPISFVEYNRFEAESGGRTKGCNARLVLIHTGGNLGFAGGTNVGLKYSLNFENMEYAWLLNNDTIVREDALSELVEQMRGVPSAGICGSSLLYYSEPNRFQAMGGGRYNCWRGIAKDIGREFEYSESINNYEISIEYDCGASMFVSKSFLVNIGLMSEDYFLYFEELDWANRAGKKYTMTYAPKSIVYHKEGATLGTNKYASSRSSLSDYYMVRNRFRINRKYYPYALITLYLWIPAMFLNRLIRGQWSRALMVLRVALCRKIEILDKRYGINSCAKYQADS
jgi:GT2 family glycosyltransferase